MKVWSALMLLECSMLAATSAPPCPREAVQDGDGDATLDIGLLADGSEDPGSLDYPFVRAANLVVDDWNRRGGVVGQRVRLVVRDVGSSAKETSASIRELLELGVAGMLAPLEAEAREAVSKSCAKSGLPVVASVADDEEEVALLAHVLAEGFRTDRIGVVSDGSREAKALHKGLESRLPPPCELVCSERIDAKQKSLEKSFAKTQPDVLVIDAPAAEVAEALRGALAHTSLPIVLTSRSFGPALHGLDRAMFAVAGRCASTFRKSAFLEEHREEHGEPGLGAIEAFEMLEVLLRAFEAAGSTDPEAVRVALQGVELAGPRGKVSCAPGGVLSRPLGLWRLAGGAASPHYPAALALVELSERARDRAPDPDLGAPFRELRTGVFALEEDTQWVLVTFDQGEKSTIDDDLARLGLSTGGRSPLVDRLVEEELLARMMTMMVPKFRRNPDGSSIPEKSLKISFTATLPPKVKVRNVWTAYIAGDDPGAGGRAYPGQGYCEIYSTNLRKNIFQEHALDPPIDGDDLAYLDGSYTFATDYARDRRSEEIRALINAYAGAMALTGAHEIGHLCGLDHSNEDPYGIMNVNEGAGLDPRDGRFSEASMALLEKRLGITE